MMSPAPLSAEELKSFHESENERIRLAFEATHEGRVAVRQRTELVDSLCLRLWRNLISEAQDGPASFCLVAVGGYGRRSLFPGSDVDLLFLCADQSVEREWKDGIRSLSQELWDLRLRVSPATRTLQECSHFDRENVEFTISLLDSRYLAGDLQLFNRLQQTVIPNLVVRERQPLVQRLAELSRARYAKFADTIFHLEPNVKDVPGGLRDYNVAWWLSLITALEKRRVPKQPEALIPDPWREEAGKALDFLFSARCFLHYRAGEETTTCFPGRRKTKRRRPAWEFPAARRGIPAPGCATTSAMPARSAAWP